MEEAKQTCPFCTAEVPAEAKKCRFCGEWLAPPPPPAGAPRLSVPDEAAQRRMDRLPIIVAVIAAVGLVVMQVVGMVVMFTLMRKFVEKLPVKKPAAQEQSVEPESGTGG